MEGPSFVIAGVQKGGTSALWTYLRRHPSLYLPDRKELHFFDNDGLDWSDPPYHLMQAHFSNAPAAVVRGEATPIYTYWEPCLSRIHAYQPAMKLIILLRCPIARAWSHWRMETTRGSETLSFSEAIRGGRTRFSGQHRVYSYVERGFYAPQMRRAIDLFGRDQMLFVATTELRDERAATLARVCQFLSVADFDFPPAEKIVSPVPYEDMGAPKVEDVAYLRELFRKDSSASVNLTGVRLEPEF